jgi:vacuolar-type H+-ATPase subunit I/STV1
MIDRTISLILSKDKKLLKEHKTRSSAVDFLVSTNDYLTETQSKLDILNIELMHIDGIDKNISELIATIKRELTRREKELYTVRMERK